jgi:transposase
VEQVLAPRLEPGHVVILDNLSAHQVAGVRQLIEDRGAQVLYLPPYSPDFNPIEMAWSKLKPWLRGVKARVLEQLEPAIADALSAITAQNARAFFRHCGYGIQQLWKCCSDEAPCSEALNVLRGSGYGVVCAPTLDDAEQLLSETPFQAAFIGLGLFHCEKVVLAALATE